MHVDRLVSNLRPGDRLQDGRRIDSIRHASRLIPGTTTVEHGWKLIRFDNGSEMDVRDSDHVTVWDPRIPE